MSTYHEYEQWLGGLTTRFGFNNRSSLLDAVSSRRRHMLLKNIKLSVGLRGQQTYGFGLQASQDRDPWAEITVGCVQQVLELVASVKKEAVRHARRLGLRRVIGDEELQRYVDLRLRHDGVISDIAKPVARIVCLAMSANPKNTWLRCETWLGHQSRLLSEDDRPPLARFREKAGRRSSTWREIIATIVHEIRCSEGRGVPVLIVLDCALGWPRRMAVAIESHEAGAALWSDDEKSWRRRDRPHRPRRKPSVAIVPLTGEEEEVRWYRGSQTHEEAAWREERNQFFRRRAEIRVRRCLRFKFGPVGYGPYGLDVGADKSARTTHQALRLIDVLRRELKGELPVLTTWCGPITQSSVIEVTTVEASRLATREQAEGVDPRRTAVFGRDSDRVGEHIPRAELESTWRMDLMLRAATAFLNGRLKTPSDVEVDDEVAQKEGWIWWHRTDGLPDSD